MNYDSSYYSDDINPYEDLVKIPIFKIFKCKPISLFYNKQQIKICFISNILQSPSLKKINLMQCIASER